MELLVVLPIEPLAKAVNTRKIKISRSESRRNASLAQLVEQMTLNHLVEGSSPSGGT